MVGKDAIIALCGAFDRDQVLNYAIEFSGDGLRHLSIDERLVSWSWKIYAAAHLSPTLAAGPDHRKHDHRVGGFGWSFPRG